ncbi:ScyD/ScyE family protein [Arthrobacter sp. HY1533]|uniref:ScyD/ScyE family protein n=1 Tax=Arthrobacter sp. HY1533 TaxID=2970919 RepID=UPI0022B9E985|nr:ScyD/ScyE family protein [Arthrobacter sp. HY1533]
MRNRIAAIAAACTFALTVSAGPALAQSGNRPGHGNHHPSPVTEVASRLISPLKVAFGPRGSLLVAESFAGQLSSFSASGAKTTLVNAPGQEIAGVSYANGTTYYFNNDQGAGPEPGAELLPARLMAMDHGGNIRQIADLSVFEGQNNPDGSTVYGVRDAAPECLAQAPYLQALGEVFSHPYASAPASNGVYVADAGANALLHVSDSGRVKLVRALPAEPVVIDAAFVAIATEMGMAVPECMMGLNYYSQAVPTDVEVNGQWLYYTVLPGVPGEALGQGKAYRTNLNSGTTQLLAQGLLAPTGIAVDRTNNVYVAQLFGDGVSVLKNGKATNVLPAAMVSDVEISGTTMAALTNALNEQTGGSLVRMGLR